MTENVRIIKKLYEYLNNITPLKTDCGKVCANKCCKGNDTDGMLLFHGEEILFMGKENFRVYFDSRYECNAVSCKGSCNREERPLSCRIFPYFLYVKDNGTLSVAPDIRAADFCPLVNGKYKIDREFLRALRISGKLIETNEELFDFLKKITSVLTDFNNL